MIKSDLCDVVILSPFYSSRNHVIDTITIHVMDGDLSVESCGALFKRSNKRASSNYGVDSKGRIACYVPENYRSWCTSNKANDNRAITIEVANDGGKDTGYHVSDKAISSLINLLADVCKRNNIHSLLWKNDKSLIGKVELQNMTLHRWFANKACPGDYLVSKHSYIAEEVNKKLSSEEPSVKKLYRVQVGAFSVKENAYKLKEKLIKEGYDAIIV